MDVLMPQLGETVAEGKIVKWFKAAGDSVKPGDNLFEIETDKTSMEVPSITAGTLSEIRFQVGEVAKVGAVVAVISGAGAAASPAAARSTNVPPKAPVAPVPAVTPAVHSTPMPRPAAPMDPFREVRTPERNYGPAKLASGTVVTPLARRLAGERGIDLSRISGSGPHGRIVARDVEQAAPGATVGAAPAAMASGASAAQVKALYEGIAYEEMPLDSMRRTIATRLVEAKQTIPHFYLTADLDCRPPDRHARGGQCRRAKEQGRPAGVQAFAQRFHHQGLGGCAPAHSLPPTRCGRATVFFVSSIPISVWRLRSRAG